MEFKDFPKIPRLSREIVITEKIDGTNAQIFIETLGVGLYEPQVQNWPFTYAKDTGGGTQFIFVGSRNKWITPKDDNYGFANWVKTNAEELLKLGDGRHFGEWWGRKIQRGYDLAEKRFSLFNSSKWSSWWNHTFTGSTECIEIPICHVVPILARGEFNTDLINTTLQGLKDNGSFAAPGYKNPEGIVIYHTAGDLYFKKTILKDESPKGQIK